jgi:PhzF family phenazine biosynthesis protein
MTDVEAHIWNAFTHNGKGGNPAGVVIEDKPLTAIQRQGVARDLGLSETAFVRRLDNAAWQVYFHTPTRAIARCGHATVAAFSYLAARGDLVEGTVHKVRYSKGQQKLRLEDGRVWLSLDHAKQASLDKSNQDAVRHSLGLGPDELPSAPVISGVGNDFVLVPLANAQALRSLRPNFERIADISKRLGVIGYYAYLPTAVDAQVQAAARMFAPAYGINEEAATGMAAGALAAHLRHRVGWMRDEYVFSQGILMPHPSPSRIFVRHAQLGRLEVGGYAGAAGSKPSQRLTLA